MLPKVAAAIIKHLKPMTVKSTQIAPNVHLQDDQKPNPDASREKESEGQEQEPSPESPKQEKRPTLTLIEGGDPEDGAPKASERGSLIHALSPFVLGKALSQFVLRIFAHKSYEKSVKSGRAEKPQGSKGALIDKKIV